jgi:hypothetical protein
MAASEVNEYVRASLPEWRAELEERTAAAANAAADATEDAAEDDDANANAHHEHEHSHDREQHATQQQRQHRARRRELVHTMGSTSVPSFEVFAHLVGECTAVASRRPTA